MRFCSIISFVLVLSVIFSSTLAARRLKFRPLSANEVYRILKEAGREDAVPEGRIVTQGIAALSGFALGLKKGVAVPLAIGLATSNITSDLMNNINNINYTALANSLPTIPPITLPTINYTALVNSLPTIPPITLPTINYTALVNSLPTIPPITLPTINYTAIKNSIPMLNLTALTSLLKGGSTSGSNVQFTTQEICFSSRSLNEINDYDDDTPEGRQTGTTPTVTGTMTTANTPPTMTTPPTAATPTVTGTDGTGTNSATTTETGNNGAVNCIILEKPISG